MLSLSDPKISPRVQAALEGGNFALLLQIGQEEGRELLIDAAVLLKKLPPGIYEWRLLKRVKLPAHLMRKELRDTDVWKEARPWL